MQAENPWLVAHLKPAQNIADQLLEPPRFRMLLRPARLHLSIPGVDHCPKPVNLSSRLHYIMQGHGVVMLDIPLISFSQESSSWMECRGGVLGFWVSQNLSYTSTHTFASTFKASRFSTRAFLRCTKKAAWQMQVMPRNTWIENG